MNRSIAQALSRPPDLKITQGSIQNVLSRAIDRFESGDVWVVTSSGRIHSAISDDVCEYLDFIHF